MFWENHKKLKMKSASYRGSKSVFYKACFGMSWEPSHIPVEQSVQLCCSRNIMNFSWCVFCYCLWEQWKASFSIVLFGVLHREGRLPAENFKMARCLSLYTCCMYMVITLDKAFKLSQIWLPLPCTDHDNCSHRCEPMWGVVQLRARYLALTCGWGNKIKTDVIWFPPG